ncbi:MULTISPECIES: MBL fold metallo-hydrolase [Bacillus]|uniref:MBL fold metallo-hydrolase n=1 Tax=Bacillus TaxID=1386 RepID=UPI0002E59519|nr:MULTISPECIES: MBL fold metallo-hydrolase [Bacillus]
MTKVEQINSTIFCIDCHDLQRKNRTGSYILKGKKSTLIETSASPSIPYILSGLEQLEVNLETIEHIIVTHIHLDHAGGAGLLLEKCPNADLIVHPKGARHLVDPSRLIAGARAVYGDDFDSLFNPILAIPKERIKIVEHGEELILEDRKLTFYHTPGHANHHISIHDSLSNGIFTGDTTGIHYQELDQNQISLILPSTSPSQFNPEAMLQSVSLIEQIDPSIIYFGHYGHSSKPNEMYKQIRYWLPIFIECGEKAMISCEDTNERVQLTSELLLNEIKKYLPDGEVENNTALKEILDLDLQVSSMGIIDTLIKNSSRNR